MKKVILFAVLLTLISCTDEQKRQQNLQSKYPNHKVEPATGLIKNAGYQFILIDSSGQIIAVSFYFFSETKISNLRNVR